MGSKSRKNKSTNKNNSKNKAVATAKVKNAKQMSGGRDTGEKYRAKRKIPLSLLLALTAPLTVCFFGTFELYAGNMGEFLFSLGDFLPLCIAFALIAAAVIFAVLMLLNGRAYDIACAVVLWITVMLFAQRYYLNLGVNALAGDGVGNAGADPLAVLFNALLWVVVGCVFIAGAILLKKRNVAHFFVTCAVILIAILAVQTIGFASLSFTTDVYTPVTDRAENQEPDANENAVKEPSILTYNNLNELSKGKNVVFFLIDRFDVRYFEALQKTSPEYLDGLDGFTFYNDYTSLYCRTYPAVSSILTGKDNDFEDTRLNYFKKIYTDGGHLRAMHNAGYDVNVYTEKYYAYDNAAYMSDYVDNLSGANEYTIDSESALSIDMIRLSLSTGLPFSFKGAVGTMSTSTFNSHAVYKTDEPLFDADMKNVYNYITENEFTKVDSRGQFTFVHLFGCHTPVVYDEEWNEIPEGDKKRNDTTMALKQSLTIIYEYIEQMKALGLYDDATIVITGDHPAALSDSKLIGEASKSDNGTRVTAMLFKKSGDSGTKLKTSTAQISQDELWNTIYESEGLSSLKTGDSFFDIPEDEQRTRRYLFERSVKLEDGTRADEIVQYKITGSARNRDNWEIEKVTVVGKIYK